MDQSEHLVEEYLRAIGFVDIVHEPDGCNLSTDFLVDDHIAVEVRRLNQNTFLPSGKTKGLEEVLVPTWQRIRNYLPTLGPGVNGESWYIGINVSRPLESWRVLEPKMRAALQAFMHSPVRRQTTLRITEHLKLAVFRAGKSYSSFFLLGDGYDENSGGFVVAEVYKNLTICIAKKAKKTANYRHKYPVWWLVLPDHIGYGLNAENQSQFRDLPRIEHDWNKVILLNPFNPRYAFEI